MLKLFTSLIIFVFIYLLFPITTFAYNQKPNCSIGYVENAKYEGNRFPTGAQLQVEVTFKRGLAPEDKEFYIHVYDEKLPALWGWNSKPKIKLGPNTNKESTTTLKFMVEPFTSVGSHFGVFLKVNDGYVVDSALCELGKIQVFSKESTQVECHITMPQYIELNEPFKTTTSVTPIASKRHYRLEIRGNSNDNKDFYWSSPITQEQQTINYSGPTLKLGDYITTIKTWKEGENNSIYTCTNSKFSTLNYTPDADFEEEVTSDAIKIEGTGGENPGASKTEIKNCDPSKNECTKAAGISCDPGTGRDNGILTAIGCIPTEPSELIAAFLRFSASIGGGIALLLMIFAGFRMITAQGNPELIKKGQEQFTSAIIGLLFIIFSVLLLQIIGVDILNLPGFRK